MYHGGDAKKKPNPKQKANFLSLITFFFAFDVLKKGYKKDIREEDIYEVLPKFKSSRLGDSLEKHWVKEQARNDNPSIYRLLWICHGKYYLFLGLIQLTMKIIMITVPPRAMGKLVSYFTANTKLTKGDAVYYAVLVIGLNIINCTYNHNYRFLITELGIKVKTAFCSIIYRKSLKLSSLSINRLGNIVTLITKDVTSFETVIIFWNDMWISLIVFVIASCIMYSTIGVAALAGVSFLIFMIPIQVYLGHLTSNLRIRAAKATDHRLQTSQETLSFIKLIKMYTWENFFSERILKVRKEEMRRIKQIYFAKAIFLEVGALIMNVTWYIIVMAYTELGHNLTAEVAFFLQECLRALKSPITTSVPLGILNTAELVASVRRIRQVLTAEEHDFVRDEKKSKPLINMKEVGFTLGNKPILRDVNLRIESGLNIVTGKVACGKSSLLKTILGEYPVCHGQLNVEGTVSYAPEQPWLFPSTIKQNILFGTKFNAQRYQKVIKICALELDFNTFKKGDDTILDDNGKNLSKGQQVRIGLARAVYSNSDIYLLDDCISSLDFQTQDFVFRECVRNFLKDKVVIMVLPDPSLVKRADNVVVVEDGTVKSCVSSSNTEELVEFEGPNNEDMVPLENKLYDNIYHERAKEGQVDLEVYKKYYQYGGGVFILTLIFILYVATQTGKSYSEKSVSKWVNTQQSISEHGLYKNTTRYQELVIENHEVLKLYTSSLVISIFCLFVRACVYFNFAARASMGLHKSMVLSVTNATMEFFDGRYLGNILNRFAKDIYTIDEVLPFNINECFKFVCTFIGIIILIVSVNVFFLIPSVIFFVILLVMRKCYLPSGRSLKRLESATRSPVIGHLNATLEGLPIIRASLTQDILRVEFDKHQDLYTSSFYMMKSTARAFAYSLDMLSNVFSAAIIIRFLVAEKDTPAGSVGLAISQASMLTGLLQWGIRQWADLESNMTSVERVLVYKNVKHENKSGQMLENFDSKGRIIYKNVNLKYDNSKQYILKNINFTIKSREKIGIVGRTGAGKSSLVSSLFRLYQYQGTITISDVDVRILPLEFLRSSIVIIPQDPFVFSGTIRSNLDPMGQHKDEEIWRAINSVNLQALFASLDCQISEGGSNFSSGQKQLICLARALINKKQIIILDEATAHVDPETDFEMNNIINENFSECTVLTIAHRLNTFMNFDRVMVIDGGEIVEFDNPNVLLGNAKGYFYKMLNEAHLRME